MPALQRTISDFIDDRNELPAVTVNDTVATGGEKMKACRADCVVVLDGDRVAGIFTERDFLNRVAARRLDPTDTKMSQVMTRDPQMLRVTDNISYAINIMAVGGYRNVPIVHKDRIVAVLSARHVITHLFDLFAEATDRDSAEITPWTDVGGG